MQSKLKIWGTILCLIGLNAIASAQTKSLPFTADSLASGNYKDVLKSFFQLSFDKLTSQDKDLQFTSNPFAVMARMDTTLLVDTNYIKFQRLRNLNFSFGLKLDSSYHFNGFSSGIKYALVNKRDETVSRAFLSSLADANKEFDTLNLKLAAMLSSPAIGATERNLYISQVNDFQAGRKNFGDLDNGLQEIIKNIANTNASLKNFSRLLAGNNQVNIGDLKSKSYTNLREEFQKKALWTVGVIDTTYSNQFFFSNIVLNTEFVKGFGKATPGLNSELNLKAAVNFVDDTLLQGRDLKRSIFTFDPSINLVFRNKKSLQSVFEFNIGGSYRYSFNQLYAGEERNTLLFKGVLRFRVYDDLWIPIQFNYDPDNGNILGFINARLNFTALSKVVNAISK